MGCSSISYAASSAKAAAKMNTTSCSVPPRQPKMFSSTPSSRTSVTAWPISSRNSRWMVSAAYSPNSTWPPSGRWNNGSEPESDSDTSNAPSRGRLMTAIALMIWRFELTDLSYHAGPMSWPPARRYTEAGPGRGGLLLTAITILLPTSLNRNTCGRVIRVVGSIRGASLPRRSWYFGIAGAALLIASGSIHLDLYLTGYRSIPTIGWLFLLQIISAYALAIAIPVTRSWLAAAAGAGFAISVLGGYLRSLKPGLFGFTEVRTTAGIVAAIIDVATFAVLATAVIIDLNLGRQALLATAAASVVALALTGAFVATPKTQPVASGAQMLQARQVGGGT